VSDFRPDERFPVLSSAIRHQLPDAIGVLVSPPYVFVVIGDRAVRYWAPETLEGDVREPGLFMLRAVPPNAPPLDEM